MESGTPGRRWRPRSRVPCTKSSPLGGTPSPQLRGRGWPCAGPSLPAVSGQVRWGQAAGSLTPAGGGPEWSPGCPDPTSTTEPLWASLDVPEYWGF